MNTWNRELHSKIVRLDAQYKAILNQFQTLKLAIHEFCNDCDLQTLKTSDREDESEFDLQFAGSQFSVQLGLSLAQVSSQRGQILIRKILPFSRERFQMVGELSIDRSGNVGIASDPPNWFCTVRDGGTVVFAILEIVLQGKSPTAE